MDTKYHTLISQNRDEIEKYLVEEAKIEEKKELLVDNFFDNISTLEKEKETELLRHNEVLQQIEIKKQTLTNEYAQQLNVIQLENVNLATSITNEMKNAIHIQKLLMKNRDSSKRKGKISKVGIEQLIQYYETYEAEKIRQAKYISSQKNGSIDMRTDVKEYIWSQIFTGDNNYDYYILFQLNNGDYGLLVSLSESYLHYRHDDLQIYIGSLWEIVNLIMTDDIYEHYIETTQKINET